MRDGAPSPPPGAAIDAAAIDIAVQAAVSRVLGDVLPALQSLPAELASLRAAMGAAGDQANTVSRSPVRLRKSVDAQLHTKALSRDDPSKLHVPCDNHPMALLLHCSCKKNKVQH